MKKTNEKFSMMVILLIPVAIAINIIGGNLTSVLKIPVDLDMIGVILVGALVGPIPAAIAGILTNLINGIFDPTWIPYVICSCFIGIFAGLLGKYNMMTNWYKLIISGIVLALVATITATPVTVFFFGGATGGGASILAAGLMATGKEILEAVLSVYIVTETIGKLISVFIAYLIIKAIPERSLVKYKFGEKYIKKNK
ncbi:ECF transporter S component [Megamonas funiformis]|uniref:ECF transporter S component n=1 Tax=Megamonas funiformis TaxID=437897 RepID=UPI0029422499|nr:ECF transporter S component [Megamonas funiformis]